PSPCLHKILLTKFSSAKMLSLFQKLPLASSCLRTMRQKLSAAMRLPLVCIKFCSQNFLRKKLSALFQGFPLPAENFACKIFFGKNAQPLSEASPRGEAVNEVD
ncbi:MAG: hypothetical protein ACLTKZ_06160, partial [Lachnospiraceae bacterium]